MTASIGKSLVVIGFFGYVGLLAASVYYRTPPRFDSCSPFVHFEPIQNESPPMSGEEEIPLVAEQLAEAVEPSRNEPVPVAIPEPIQAAAAKFQTAALDEKFGQTTETITYYPPLPPPILTSAPIYTTYYPPVTTVPSWTISGPTYIMPPPVIVRRPFFSALFP